MFVHTLSLRASQTRGVFSTPNAANTTKAPETPKMTKVLRSPDDEILLTELAFDTKDFIPYEINSVILVAEKEQANPHGVFRGFLETKTKEFFVEIPDEEAMKMFTRSALLTIMKLAEEAGADSMYICLRKTVKKQEATLKTFLFLGFEKLTSDEQKKISMTKTHGILKCSLKGEESTGDE